jgi:hypothetical protein
MYHPTAAVTIMTGIVAIPMIAPGVQSDLVDALGKGMVALVIVDLVRDRCDG